jgi:phosphate-selective porin OprO/OprP
LCSRTSLRRREHGETAFGRPDPSHGRGALKLAVRYSTADLDGGLSRTGDEHDWTLGLNRHIGTHFKLQANHVRARADRGNLEIDPRIHGMRAQMTF